MSNSGSSMKSVAINDFKNIEDLNKTVELLAMEAERAKVRANGTIEDMKNTKKEDDIKINKLELENRKLLEKLQALTVNTDNIQEIGHSTLNKEVNNIVNKETETSDFDDIKRKLSIFQEELERLRNISKESNERSYYRNNNNNTLMNNTGKTILPADFQMKELLNRVPIFNGDNIYKFLQACKRFVASLAHVDEKELIEILKNKLNDTIYSILGPETFETFEQFNDKLYKTFTPYVTISQLNGKMSNMKKYEGESILKFAERIYEVQDAMKFKRREKKRSPLNQYDYIELEEIAIEGFLDGLPPEISIRISRDEYLYLNNVIDRAIEEEKTLLRIIEKHGYSVNPIQMVGKEYNFGKENYIRGNKYETTRTNYNQGYKGNNYNNFRHYSNNNNYDRNRYNGNNENDNNRRMNYNNNNRNGSGYRQTNFNRNDYNKREDSKERENFSFARNREQENRNTNTERDDRRVNFVTSQEYDRVRDKNNKENIRKSNTNNRINYVPIETNANNQGNEWISD